MVGFGLFFLVHHADIELVFGSETIGWFVGFLVVGMAIFIIAVIGIFGAVLGKHKLLIVVCERTDKLECVISDNLYTLYSTWGLVPHNHIL